MNWKKIIKAPPIPNPRVAATDRSMQQTYPNNNLGEPEVVTLFEEMIDPILEEAAEGRKVWADVPVRPLGMNDDVAVKCVQKLYIDAFEGRDAYDIVTLRSTQEGPVLRIRMNSAVLDQEAHGRKQRVDQYYE